MDILRDKIVTTRKKHMCNACGRLFEKGTKMRTQVNTFDGIGTWRECPTCEKILSKYRAKFVDDYDNVIHEFCINEVLEKGQTPEDLLSELVKKEIPQAFKELAECECKDEWLRDVRINVVKCKKCGREY